ncbi:MAG: GAF domain-containing protein [Planctomycetota bacterium]
MIDPPLPPDEEQRLQTLRASCLLDTPIEKRFERITQLAQQMLDVPIAAISLVDADRQWFKSIQGLAAQETSRQVAFCAHTIVDRELQVVPDARIAERFHNNPLVTGDPGIVFYAGYPLYARNGVCLGSLCAIDHKVRTLNDYQTKVLSDLAKLAEQEIEDPHNESGLGEFLRRVKPDHLPSLVNPGTRLWNRAGTEAVLDFILDHTRGSGKMLGLLIITLEGLHGIEDRHGIETADAARRATARQLVNSLRPQDLVGDLGDGRFAIVVRTGDPSQQAPRLAERLDLLFRSLAVETPAGSLRLEVSTVMTLYLPTRLTRAEKMLAGARTPPGKTLSRNVA